MKGLEDPWGLIADGKCQDTRSAYVTVCITVGEQFLTTCLASLCALLATTDPACVVAIVSHWVYAALHTIFAKNGVLPVIAPEWMPLTEGHPYVHLQDRSYSFAKLEAFRLSGFERVVTFDADVLFMKNASGLLDIEPFAA